MLRTTQLKKQKKACSTGKMSRGISSVQIEKTFKKLNDEGINDNFVGVFPANCMNRFIKYKTVMLKKKENILLLLQTLMALTKTAPTGGA